MSKGLRAFFSGLPLLLMPALGIATERIRYLHTDHLGSVVAVTDAQGRVVERSEYDPWGKGLQQPMRDGPGYTGHAQDPATGLVYMQQRLYDPDIPRFLSVDAVTAYGGDLRHFNPYAYAYNNPYKFTDPNGRAAHIAIGGGIGALFGGGMELYRQLSTEGRVTSWTNAGIETAKGGAVGALTAAVPGSTALTFGSTASKAAVSVGNAVAVGAGGEVAAQGAKGESIDTGKALTAGVANAVGVGVGKLAEPIGKAAGTVTIPGNPGFQVTSLRGQAFTVNAIPASTTTSEGVKQTVQDVAGAIGSSLLEQQQK